MSCRACEKYPRGEHRFCGNCGECRLCEAGTRLASVKVEYVPISYSAEDTIKALDARARELARRPPPTSIPGPGVRRYGSRLSGGPH